MRRIILSFLVIFFLIAPVLIFATSGSVPDGGSGPAIDPPPGTIDDLTADDVTRMIINLRNWFAGIVLIIAVFVVLVSAFVYMTAGGDDKKVGLAKKMFINAVIGIVIALLAYGIVGLITNLINDLRGPSTPSTIF